MQKLKVFWEVPKQIDEISSNTLYLIFLSPENEENFHHSFKVSTFNGRDFIPSIESEAQRIYKQIISQIGLLKGKNKITLRKLLKSNSDASLWWFHPVAFRDSEGEPTYSKILQILTIINIIKDNHIDSLTLYGADKEMEKVLSSEISTEVKKDLFINFLEYVFVLKSSLKEVISRIRLFFNLLKTIHACRKLYQLPEKKIKIAFSGFWNWSFYEDLKISGELSDRYFASLPNHLKNNFGISIGYFAWLSSGTSFGRNVMPFEQLLKPLKKRDDVVLLQSFLKPIEVFRVIFNFKPFLLFKQTWRNTEDKKMLIIDDIDWSHLFSRRLIYGFLGTSIPQCELMALATERAVEMFEPKMTMSFLEHYPISRAFYSGVRLASPITKCWAVQHASYNKGKTWYFLDPKFERSGDPDGIKVPSPDGVFVMGRLGQRLFESCGYPSEAIKLTGSPRYDYLSKIKNRSIKSNSNSKLEVLLVATLNIEIELDVLEALCIAAKGLDQIELKIRSHPSVKLENHPQFWRWSDQVTSSTGSLEEDLDSCSLVIYSYSTVAEEAILQGLPAWQWMPKGLNGSALSEIENIPRFTSVSALRKALKLFQKQPLTYSPSKELQKKVETELFFSADGGAVARIADSCRIIINSIK